MLLGTLLTRELHDPHKRLPHRRQRIVLRKERDLWSRAIRLYRGERRRQIRDAMLHRKSFVVRQRCEEL